MNILVTGGAGYIGSQICKRLVRDGHEVVVIDNLSNSSKDSLMELHDSPLFTFYEFDVNNTFKLRGVFDRHPFDMVFHFAGNADTRKGEENPYADIENTLQTTLNILEMMRTFDVKKFFSASSSNVYGNRGKASRVSLNHAADIALWSGKTSRYAKAIQYKFFLCQV